MQQLLNEGGTIYGGIYWNRQTEQRLSDKRCLEQYGYKVYSQNDEDGIIQEIFKRIGVTSRTFIEFGVQDGLESNCHYLLHQGWHGLWLEADEDDVEQIYSKFYPVIRTGQLLCEPVFITRENINGQIEKQGFGGEIDLLSIDVDGNDYYIWEAIDVVSPRVVIIEYNGKFPPDCEWKMAYHAGHQWDESDWQGASLKALELLGRRKGYQLAGTNLVGANAFFVRKDLAAGKFYEPADAESLYNPLRLNIHHKNGHPARYCLRGQQEGLGIFNYPNAQIVVPGYGFGDWEGEDGNRYAWMMEKNCQLIIRKGQGIQELEIPFYITESVFSHADKHSIVFSFDGKQKQEIPVAAGIAKCRVKLPKDHGQILKIDVLVPLPAGEGRCMGIAALFESAVAAEDTKAEYQYRSCVCKQEQLESKEFRKMFYELKLGGHFGDFLHRKIWEYIYIVLALKERGMLKAGKRGLGFAVGTEPLPAYFASQGCSILATDLDIEDPSAKMWAQTNENAAGDISRLNEKHLCPDEIFRKNVTYRDVDMNAVPQDLKGYDFCWSSSAVEHVGSLTKSRQFLKNMLDTLKPGGIAVHTTEYNLSSDEDTIEEGGTVIYRKRDILELADWLRAQGHAIDLDLSLGQMEGDLFVDQPPYFQINPRYHLRLNLDGYTSTSIGLIIRKAGGTPK